MPNITQNTSCALALIELPPTRPFPTTRLPRTIIEKGKLFSSRREKQYLIGRALLAELLYKMYDIETLPEITISPKGRPLFQDPQLPDFNISHSGNKVIVALSQQALIGVDVELIRPKTNFLAIAEYRFTSEEVLWIKEHSIESQERAFWQIWTIRESILKLMGMGVWQMRQIQIDPILAQIKEPSYQALFNSCYLHQQLMWSVTTSRPIPINFSKLYYAEVKEEAIIINSYLASELLSHYTSSNRQ